MGQHSRRPRVSGRNWLEKLICTCCLTVNQEWSVVSVLTVLCFRFSLFIVDNFKHVEVGAEKAMAPHSSTLVWKIPWMEEPGGLQSMGSLRVRHN